jgi:hemolysin III
MNMKIEKPLLRGHFHQAMFFVSLGACILLVLRADSRIETISTIVYSLGALTMYGISALYHRVTWSPERRLFMKKLDHAAIYIMIAGTFTPITQLALPPESGKTLLISIWGIALLGMVQSIFFVNLPKIVSAILYLIAGYMIAPYFSELIPRIGSTNIMLIIAGGLAYSIGAIAYGLKRPVFNPKYFGYHEFFHIMVCIGSIFHFGVIYSILN